MQGLFQGETLVIVEGVHALLIDNSALGVDVRGHPFVPALCANGHGPAGEARRVQYRCQGSPGPFAGAEEHTLLGPGRPGSLVLEIVEETDVAPRTLHDGANGAGGEAPQLFIAQLQWVFDLAAEGEAPVFGADRVRYPKMLDYIVQIGGRDETFHLHRRRKEHVYHWTPIIVIYLYWHGFRPVAGACIALSRHGRSPLSALFPAFSTSQPHYPIAITGGTQSRFEFSLSGG